MRRFICMIRGHKPIRVSEVGVVARPGGMLPSLDGLIAFKPDPAGDREACLRCHQVLRAHAAGAEVAGGTKTEDSDE